MKQQHSSLEIGMALLFAVCVLAALVLLTGCESKSATVAEARATVKDQTVTFPKGSQAAQRFVIERVTEPTDRDLVLPGRLVWDEERTVRVFPPFAGRVVGMRARPGDKVAAGAPLAEVTSPDFAQAQADARKAQADLGLAQKALERQKELNANGVASTKDLQQAQADEARARAELERAASRLKTHGASPESPGDFLLRAPIAGTVVERNLNPGQELRPDKEGPPLFVVSDPTRLWVMVDASEADARGIRTGMALVVSSSQIPDDAFAGTLTQLSDFVDPASRTVKLRGEVPNPDRVLKAEMFVQVRLKLPRGDSPTIPTRAVYLDGVRRYVFVKTGDTAFTRRNVRLGPEYDGRVAVLTGVQPGESVVTSGNLMLQQLLTTTRVEPVAAQ